MHAYQLNFDDIQNLPIKIEAQDEFGKRYKTVFQKGNDQVQLIIYTEAD